MKDKPPKKLLTHKAGDKRTWLSADLRSMDKLKVYQHLWMDVMPRSKSSQKDIMNSQKELITITISLTLENEIYVLVLKNADDLKI